MKYLYKFPILNIIIIIGITVFFVIFLPKLNFDNDVYKFLPDDNPSRIASDKMAEDFGNTDFIIIGIKAKNGSILSKENLKIINDVSNKLENIVYRENKKKNLIQVITSLRKKNHDQNDINKVQDDNSEEDYEKLFDENIDGANEPDYDSLFDENIDDKDNDDYEKLFENIEDENIEVDKKSAELIKDGDLIVDNVISITNTDYIEGVEGGLNAEKLVKEIPQNEAEMQEFKKKLFDWDIYKYNLYSEDLKSTSIIINLDNEVDTKHNIAAYNEIKKILKSYDNHFEFYLSGLPIVTLLVSKYMENDMLLLIPIVLLVVFIVLLISFRRISGVVLPMLTVMISTIWAMGLMAIFERDITIVSTIIPVLLMAIGSAYGIHIITHYYDEIIEFENTEITKERHKKIVFHVVKLVGLPVILAAVTTFIGFLSFLTSPIIPLKDFGLFTAFGVIASVIVALFLIPSILLLKQKYITKKKREKKNNGIYSKIYKKFILLIKYKYITLSISGVLLIFAIFGTINIDVGQELISFFRKGVEVVKADKFLNENFAGTNSIEIKIIGQNDGDLTNPSILKNMDNLSIYLKNKYPKEIGKITGFHDMVKRMNYVLNYPDNPDDLDKWADYNEIPVNPAKYALTSEKELQQLISQYLMLYSGNLDDMVQEDQISPVRARMTVVLHSAEGKFVRELINEIFLYANNNFDKKYTIEVAGSADTQNAINDLIIISQILSILVAIFIVFIILLISNRSFVAGLIGIVPLGFAILLNFGIMYIFKISLNVATALIAGIAVGIGVDYTIHFLSAYKYHRKLSNNLFEVTEKTYKTSGKAIIFNAISVGCGFAVLSLSNFIPLRNMGLLISIIMFTSSLAALTILPCLLNIFDPKFLRR